MLERECGTLVVAATVSIVAALAGGCQPGERKPPQEAQAPYRRKPTPRFLPESILSVSLDRIREYADQLQFDTTLGAADQQPIDFQRARVGTERAQLARIEPESASYDLSEKELEQGRIIARIRSDAEVPSLGLGPRWTWWWVDKRGPGGRWRSVFIPESEKFGKRVALRDSLELMSHYRPWRQAIARFWFVRVTSPHADPLIIESWGTCGGCCKQVLVVGVSM